MLANRQKTRDIRLLLVEDRGLFRQGLACVLDREPGFEVVGQAGSLAEARVRVSGGEPDVVVAELELPDGDGVDLISELYNIGFRVLVLTISLDPDRHARALEAGAEEVLTKMASLAEIREAIKRLARAQETGPRGSSASSGLRSGAARSGRSRRPCL